MNGRYNEGDVVLGSWMLVRLLGEGAYGKVYEAHREGFGTIYKAAIKIMTIPPSQSEVASARAEGMDEASVTAYFRSMVEDVVQEFALMSRLKGMTNIVSCEDFQVEQHTTGVGWDILIRMELLTPMLNHMSGREMTRSDVIKLGIDMCHALELCQRYNIIHRDIKPENIFISDTGDYKLGDFGVARTLEKTTGGLSKKGTYTYMAPEIYRDEKYGSTVDIYSLGIVLYRLLNNNRAPFLPAPPQPITHSERERALVRRISGEQLPPPANAEGRLGEIVLKACAYDPKDRYSSPLQMRQELEAIWYHQGEDAAIYGRSGQIAVDSRDYTRPGEDSEATVYEPRSSAARPEEATVYAPRGEKSVVKEQPSVSPAAPAKKKIQPAMIAAAVAVVALVAVLLVLLPKLRQSDPRVDTTPAPVEETAPPVETPAPTSVPEAASEPTPEPTAQPEEAPGDDSPRIMLDESWSYGSIKISSIDAQTLQVELTDNRIPNGFPHSETPGKNVESWGLVLDFGRNTLGFISLELDWNAKTLADVSLNQHYDTKIGAFSPKSSPCTLTGNTFSFEIAIPELTGLTVGDIQVVNVNLGTEKENFVDNHSYVID